MPLSSFMENFLKRRQELEAQDKFDATLGEQQADRALQAQQLAESIKAREADDARMKADQDFRRSQATQTQQWDALVGMSQGKLERGPGLLTVAGPGILGIPDKVLPPPPGGMEVKDIGQLFPVPLDVQKRREVEAEIAGRRALVTENQKILNDFITKQRETGDPLPKDFEHRANLFIATGLQLPKEDIDDQIVRL